MMTDSHGDRMCRLSILQLGSLASGLFLTVFTLLALSAPGRIDIVDGQTRYEVARSLVDHHDSVIRNPAVWFSVFPGRNGERYTTYRLPQSALGVPAIWLADGTGPISEPRRQFFFSLLSAGAGAVLSVCYLWWFLSTGLAPKSAALWSLLGVLCTPAWFYSTSTFDDILGTVAVTGGLVAAVSSRRQSTWWGPVFVGLLAGLAFNCKPPLALFALPMVAALDDRTLSTKSRFIRAGTVAMGLAAGVSVYLAYDALKFPAGTREFDPSSLSLYMPPWPGNVAMGLLCFAISPATGVPFYAPATALGVLGLKNTVPHLRWTLLISTGMFVVFIASMSFFKGDPSWGPRYLTPVCALFWLFSPAGAAALRLRTTTCILLCGMVVQLLGLSVDMHRLYVERRLPSAFGAVAPILYFDVRNAHLLNRPREIVEIWRARYERGGMFSPVSPPTFAFPIIDRTEKGPEAIRTYKVLNSFRPWWASQRYLAAGERPVSMAWALAALASVGSLGAALLAFAWKGLRARSGEATIRCDSSTDRSRQHFGA